MGSVHASVLCLPTAISLGGSSEEQFLAKAAIATWTKTSEVSSSSQLSSHAEDFRNSHTTNELPVSSM